MKKLSVLLSVGVMTLVLASCGDNNGSSDQSAQQTAEGGAETTAVQETETSPAPETGLSSAQEDNETSETNMDLAEGWSEEMTALRDAVAEALGENYWPNTAVTPEMLEGTFGITSDLYEDYMGEMPMISTNVDTLLIIKAKSDKVDAVEEALNEYRDNLINNTTQYPMNLGKIQASRIERLGDYVCFVQLGADTTAASESGDEAVITQCQEQNELAIEILSRNVEH